MILVLNTIIMLPLFSQVIHRNFGIQINEFNNKTNRKLLLTYKHGSFPFDKKLEVGETIGEIAPRKHLAIKLPISPFLDQNFGNLKEYQTNLLIIDANSNEKLLILGLSTQNVKSIRAQQSAALLSAENGQGN